MSEPADSGRSLEVSVSFGKFENDSLSWEKWSSFSPNKYLEEVEKCSTPGSVAQKKAYFEAHYKKIAARKADPLEPGPNRSRSEEENRVGNGFSPPNVEGSGSEVQHEHTVICPMSSDTVNENGSDPSNNPETVSVEEQTPQKNPEITDRDGIVLVEEENPQNNPDDVGEQKLKVKGHMKGTEQKRHPSMNDSTPFGTRKTLASPAVKSSRVSAPRLSPELTSKVVVSPSSAKKIKNVPENKKPVSRSHVSPQSLTKSQNGSLLHRSKNSPVTDNGRVNRTSLHMSLSLGPANSGASQNTARKSMVLEMGPTKSMASHVTMGRSLIMDRMGDKEIVKRAFKTFRNSLNDVKSSEQATPKRPEPKISTSLTPRGENGRFGKPDERLTNQKAQSGTKSKSLPSRTAKDASVERRKSITTKPSIGVRNLEINEIEKDGTKQRLIKTNVQ